MEYSLDSITEDCYEGTSCLINKLGIRDEEKLKEFEAAITFAKTSEYELQPRFDTFDAVHYQGIHRFLFEDIYDWAGEYRTVNMSKKGTAFAGAGNIPDLMDAAFKRLKEQRYFKEDTFDTFVQNIADFYQVTNHIHPFREGNGRTQRLFIAQLIRHAGYEINFSEIDGEELMIATIQAANGVRDNLIALFKKSIRKR